MFLAGCRDSPAPVWFAPDKGRDIPVGRLRDAIRSTASRSFDRSGAHLRCETRPSLLAQRYRVQALGSERRYGKSETYRRVRYQIERRRLTLRIAQGGSGSPQPMPDPDALNPWRVNPATVEHDTRVTTLCTTAAVRLRSIVAGAAAVPGRAVPTASVDSSCRGRRAVFSVLTHCRGRGTMKCTSCRGGWVGCSSCCSAYRSRDCVAQPGPNNALASKGRARGMQRRGVHRKVTSPEDFDD